MCSSLGRDDDAEDVPSVLFIQAYPKRVRVWLSTFRLSCQACGTWSLIFDRLETHPVHGLGTGTRVFFLVTPIVSNLTDSGRLIGATGLFTFGWLRVGDAKGHAQHEHRWKVHILCVRL